MARHTKGRDVSRLKDPAAVRKIARKSLFEALDGICEGAIIVDRDARIIWLSDKYAARLKLPSAQAGIGRVVEDVIPNSLMREVVRTGEPILLDIMQFGDESFVVMRVPVKDERGRVIGAAGFMLFDRVQALQPLVAKVERLRSELADTRKSLAAERRAKYTFSNFIGASPAAKEVEPLGSNRVTKVDVRVIAASSVDLRQMVSMGRFRSDLYYRLSVLPIELPPLRERIGDLESLCDYILEEIAQRSGRPQRELTATALAVLSAYDWPGNIRELRNVLEQVMLTSDNPRLSAEEFSLVLPRVAATSRLGDRPTLRLSDVVAD